MANINLIRKSTSQLFVQLRHTTESVVCAERKAVQELLMACQIMALPGRGVVDSPTGVLQFVTEFLQFGIPHVFEFEDIQVFEVIETFSHSAHNSLFVLSALLLSLRKRDCNHRHVIPLVSMIVSPLYCKKCQT